MEQGYTKQNFQKFILENITKGVSRDGRPAKSVKDMMSFCLAFIGVGAGFLIVGLIVLSESITGSAILFTLFPVLFISVGIWKALQLRVYRSLERYFETKEILLEKNTLLEVLKEKDRENIGIDPYEVGSFSLILTNLSTAYTQISGPIEILEDGGSHFTKQTGVRLIEFTEKEKSWLIDYMISCRNILRSWLDNHTKELKKADLTIDSLETKSVGGEEALTLASARLESHIENLEKIRIKL